MTERSGSPFGYAMLAIFGALVAAFLLLPLVILCIQSFTAESFLSFPPPSYGTRWYRHVAAAANWREAALSSLVIAAIVTPLSLVLGTLAALGLDRGPMRGRGVLYGILISPMILPHIVLGLGIFRIALDLHIDDSLLSIVPAHLTITVPFVVISVGASLQSFDTGLEKAAQSLGASPLRALWHITLPIIRPGLVGGGIFAFIMSFDEFIITYFLSVQTRTLPLEIFSTLRYQVSPAIAAVSALTIAFSAALTVALMMRGQVISAGRIVR